MFNLVPLFVELFDSKIHINDVCVRNQIEHLESFIEIIEKMERNRDISMTIKEILSLGEKINLWLAQHVKLYGESGMSVKYENFQKLPLYIVLYGSLHNISTECFEDFYQVLFLIFSLSKVNDYSFSISKDW